ncbi:MAG: hypothetical protein IJT51_06385, partial [Bacteroidales bacterium]|nr:hypothetical protein [Bacteroidales bacterium]
MKKVLLFIAVSLMFVGGLLAQAPQKFTYQAVVRDAYNTLVPSKPIGVKISILQSGLNGPVVYAEEHTTVTNANGLMTLQIGGGTVVNGDFASIDWSAGPYFLKCETDPQGGTNYTVTGAQQLLSVPYALYSEKTADAFSGDYNDLSNAPTIPTTTDELVNDAGFITAADIPDSVSYFVNDAGYITKDSIPNTVSTFINDANYITKDSIPTNVSAFINDAGYLTSYTEVQALSISNDTIFLTNGGFVKLPAGFDGDYNSLTNTPTNVSHFTNDANYITKDSIPTNVSAFINDAGYLTSYTEVQALS